MLRSRLIAFSIGLATTISLPIAAQSDSLQSLPRVSVDRDTLYLGRDTLSATLPILPSDDSIKTKKQKMPRDWATWKPNPKRAMWLALVLPGAGQIYNRKYWKLPIVYGGFVGCIYAMRWNNQMYRDYSQAYLDIMDDDPNTQSYNQFLHLGSEINSSNESRYQELFRKRKDRYRRWRDMSFFCLVGVYAISVIDAYVDATLSEFDISDDLTMRVEPVVLPSGSQGSGVRSGSLGVSCSLTF